MALPSVCIVRSAGTNCDREAHYAFEEAGAFVERVHITALVARPARLHDYHVLLIPGGFSYGDDLGAGTLLANELTAFLGEELRKFREARKIVLGICNGFQVLVKSGLLPGVPDGQGPLAGEGAPRPQATLTNNDSGKFEDRWVHLKVCSRKVDFLDQGASTLYLPVAHGEGKFVARDEGVLRRLEENDQVVFRYVTPDGGPAAYPWNPNGSQGDIAGICDPTGRILGLMPHPERHAEATNHPRWTREGISPRPDGAGLFASAVRYVRERLL